MEFIIGVLVVGAFIGLIVFFLKKENNKLKEMVGNLNEEQKKQIGFNRCKIR